MARLYYLLLATLVACGAAFAQRQPQTAQVDVYVPLVLDGGPKSDQFQTTLSLVNTSSTAASATLYSHAPDGSGWSLDFGSGPATSTAFTVPSGGALTMKTAIGGSVSSGWVAVFSTAPLQVVATVREIVNGRTGQQFTIQPILPNMDYVWPGDQNSVLVLANQYATDTVTVNLTAVDSSGTPLGKPIQIPLPGLGQTLVRISDKFPNVSGISTIVASGANRPHDMFIATSLIGDGTGYLSSLPDGGATWPISHWDRIWMVFRQVSNAAVKAGFISSVPDLKILDGQVVNAYAQGGTTVAITLGLSQLISDSPSELAFALAHELGHIYQQQNGVLVFNPDAEFDADIWGALISMTAGYDPYAAAGTLTKLSMATGTAGLASQFEAQLSSDAHKSFNTRLENIFSELVTACSLSDATAQNCATYKSVFHPNIPSGAPLSVTVPKPAARSATTSR